MPNESLGDYLSLLHDAGEVVRISVPVDSALEIAEITRRANQSVDGGPVLLFESVRGSTMPVVTNLFANRARVCRALGVRSGDELVDRMSPAAQTDNGARRWTGLLGAGSPLSAGFPPRVLKQGYCQQIVKLGRDVNLWELPALRSWPVESHPVITLGQVITRHPLTGVRSLELVPIQIIDQQRLVPAWHRYHRGYQHWLAAQASAQQLPIAISLGAHAGLTIAASATLPEDADPYDFVGILQQNAVELVKCRTNELEVPAHAEIVIEGMLDPSAACHFATPVALPVGYAGVRAEQQPTIQVTALTHRANPIYPAQVVGVSGGDDAWIRWSLERLFLPWVRATAPEIMDCHSLSASGGRSWLFARIRKMYPRQAHKVLHALWSHPQTMLSKGIVIVDETVDVQIPDEVWAAFAAHVDPAVDVILAAGMADIDDPAANSLDPGRKLGIDATEKFPEERAHRPGLTPLRVSAEVRQLVETRWAGYGIPIREEHAS